MSVLASSAQPKRRCIVCGDSANKSDLLRVVRRAHGSIELSPNQHGRGAYVHRNPRCLDAAAERPKPLARALRQTPPPHVLRQIAQRRLELTAASDATDIP